MFVSAWRGIAILVCVLCAVLNAPRGFAGTAPPPAPGQGAPAETSGAPAETSGASAALVELALPPDAAPRQLEHDARLTTASGTSFEAAKGWFVGSRDGRITLEDPDRELTLVLTELRSADGQEAIAQAWKQVQPDFARPVRHTMTPPAREGWDEIVQLVYEMATVERRTVMAVARRKADIWYVALLDGSDAVLDRRGAQLQTALVSFKAPGTEKESFAGKPPQALEGEPLERFAAFVEEARVACKIPGAAVAVVQDGKIVFERGFGVREQGKPEPVTSSSLFLIGSTTKSLTTFMMARLVEEGVLAWNRPVVEIFPEFSLADAEVTRQLTLQHTVCACTGLPRQDMEFLFEFGQGTPEKTVASMRTMKPTTGFGETFQYSNPMVSTGGYVAAHAASADEPLGPAYDHAMKARVFEPLGMSATTFDFAEALAAEHATPHGMDLRSEMAPLPIGVEKALIPVRPAGGAWSSARDMARYIQMELSHGMGPGGKRLISAENLLYRRTPQVKITDDLSYGLGLFVENDHGVPVIHHGGNTLGFTSDLFFLPEHGLGAVILTNAGGANAFRATVKRRFFEILFNGREEARETLTYSLGQREKVYEKILGETNFNPETAWLTSLAGTYRNEALGRVEVRLDGDRATFDAGEWQSPIGQRKGPDGTAKLMLTGAPYAGFELLPGHKDGHPILKLELSQQEYVFEQTP